MPVSLVGANSYDRKVIKKALLEALELLGMGAGNPFCGIVKPGDQVFLKPNWVAHRYRESCPYQYNVFTTITHPNVVKEIVKLVDQALCGKGRIIIGDNPSIDADFKALMDVQDLNSIDEEVSVPLEILDLRPLVCDDLKYYGQKDKMVKQPGDPRGETVINLGKESMLYGMNPKLFRGVFNERKETIEAHSGETHLYSISNSIFQSDVFISIPKLKTHHKAGTTLNLKGLVGTVGKKNYLVHWREGFPLIGGDAYPDFFSWLKDKFRKVKKRGAWCGNDTIWRMVVDLYTVIQRGPKTFFSIIDGILGGQGEGPFCPEPKESKVLIAGTDLLETDVVATRLMGFNPEKVPYLAYFLNQRIIEKDKIDFRSNIIDPGDLFDNNIRHLGFKAPKYWQNLTGGRS